MPTIKVKKEMNLPELIEWLWENDIRNRQIRADQDISAVSIDKFGDVYTTDYVKRDYTFTVEIEEEITEDTVIPEILTVYDEGITDLTNNKSLNDLIKNNLKSAYIMNDDLRLILIWRDGKLVE